VRGGEQKAAVAGLNWRRNNAACVEIVSLRSQFAF
jgi:hypothetical protein